MLTNTRPLRITIIAFIAAVCLFFGLPAASADSDVLRPFGDDPALPSLKQGLGCYRAYALWDQLQSVYSHEGTDYFGITELGTQFPNAYLVQVGTEEDALAPYESADWPCYFYLDHDFIPGDWLHTGDYDSWKALCKGLDTYDAWSLPLHTGERVTYDSSVDEVVVENDLERHLLFVYHWTGGSDPDEPCCSADLMDMVRSVFFRWGGGSEPMNYSARISHIPMDDYTFSTDDQITYTVTGSLGAYSETKRFVKGKALTGLSLSKYYTNITVEPLDDGSGDAVIIAERNVYETGDPSSILGVTKTRLGIQRHPEVQDNESAGHITFVPVSQSIEWVSERIPYPITWVLAGDDPASERIAKGFLMEEQYYVPVADLAEMTLANAPQTLEDGTIRLSYWNDYRTLSLNPKTGSVSELCNKDWDEWYDYPVNIPMLAADDTVYVSVSDYLSWLGCDWLVQPESPNLVINMPSDMYTVLSLYTKLSEYGRLDFTQMGMSEKAVENMFTAAGISMALSRMDVTITDVAKAIFSSGKLIEEDMEDTLLAILAAGDNVEERASQSKDNHLKTFNNTTAMLNWASVLMEEGVMEVQQFNARHGRDVDYIPLRTMDDVISFADMAVSEITEVYNYCQQVKTYEQITASQIYLFELGLLKHIDESASLKIKEFQFVRAAIDKVSSLAKKEVDALYQENCNLLLNTLDIVNNGLFNDNPINPVWSAIKSTATIIAPSYSEQQRQLMHAYCAMIIQEAAFEQVVAASSQWGSERFANGPYDWQTQIIEWLRSAMLLQVKSTLTARQALIDSGKLSQETADTMANINQSQLTPLLTMLETCDLNGPGYEQYVVASGDFLWILDKVAQGEQ